LWRHPDGTLLVYAAFNEQADEVARERILAACTEAIRTSWGEEAAQSAHLWNPDDPQP
jgi:hypothetical protein